MKKENKKTTNKVNVMIFCDKNAYCDFQDTSAHMFRFSCQKCVCVLIFVTQVSVGYDFCDND